MNDVRIFFEASEEFLLRNIQKLNGVVGLYFISTVDTKIQYPFKQARLIYIGMSERKTNSIGSRLTEHFEGQSGNLGITNYKKVNPLQFTYINFEMLRNIWDYRIEDLESYFINDFVKNYGVYPICNNKTGFEILKNTVPVNLQIDWAYFD